MAHNRREHLTVHEDNIQLVRREVLRLLQGQQKFLDQLMKPNGVLESRQADGAERALDMEKVVVWNEALKSEAYKVGRLEMTLAVVGTMKAGKSTTINAIVGTEVLPNRNRPMTTLPTIIRHVPGKVIPELTFPKAQPFIEALGTLKTRLQELNKQGVLKDIPFYAASDDGRSLIDGILKGGFTDLTKTHKGPEAIFEFLQSINDVSRLWGDVLNDERSPLEEYDSIDEFPIIEVEFFHLRNSGAEAGQGRFSLVDTPGPNEAGQTHLKKILEEQLEQASAVLAVLDYTQLNSEADAEVREALTEIAEHSGDRLFVLVNKFDQKDRNGMDADDVRRYVVHDLFDEGMLTPERVHPVSSRFGYLANRALHELDLHGKLPDPQQHEWVQDFADLALGRRWEKLIDDADAVRDSASELWRDGQFEAPLAQVILKASNRAAFISLASAIAKMESYDREVLNTLSLQNKALSGEFNAIQRHVDALEGDVKAIVASKDMAKATIKEGLGTFDKVLDSLFLASRNELVAGIASLFVSAKQQEKKEELRMAEKRQRGQLEKSFSPFMALFGKDFASKLVNNVMAFSATSLLHNVDLKIDPEAPNKFTSRAAADEFLDQIHHHINRMHRAWTTQTEKAATDAFGSLEKRLMDAIVTEVRPVLDKAAAQLQSEFDARLEFPVPPIDKASIDFKKIGNKSLQAKTERQSYTYYERKWYTLWLKEYKRTGYEDVEVFYVDAMKIRDEVTVNLKGEVDRIKGELGAFTANKIQTQIDGYIDALAKYLEGYRRVLMDAQKLKKQEGAALRDAQQTLERLIPQANEHQSDLWAVHKGLKALDQDKEPTPA
jgi:GTPase SAR1 family protein